MEYKVKVVEVHETERYYFVDAKNKTEAKKMAKDYDWYDACDVEYRDVQLTKIKVLSIENN